MPSTDVASRHNLFPTVPTETDHSISPETARRIEDAIPENTRRAYAADRLAFQRWCALAGRRPLPATAETAAEYAAFLADGGAIQDDGTRKGPAAPRSIERAFSAIRTEHEMAGYANQPGMKGARLVINGHRRDRAKAGVRDRQAAPITIEQLRALVETCDPDTLAGARDRAMIVLGFAMMVRRSELVALDVADIDDEADGVSVLVKWSKTDQDAAGEKVTINYGSNTETCPVRSVQAWRDKLLTLRPSGGPLFLGVDQKDRLAGDLGYSGWPGRLRLGDKAVGAILQRAGRRAGVDVRFTAHSLRVGGATSAYRAGNDLLSISRRGRWKDGSPVLLRYVRIVDKWKSNPMSGVL